VVMPIKFAFENEIRILDAELSRRLGVEFVENKLNNEKSL